MIGLGLGVHNIPMNLSAGAGFDISTIPGLQVWAKNQVGVTSSSTNVNWADSSGNGNDLHQSVNVLATILNNKYDATDGSFNFAGASSSGPLYFDYPNQTLGAFTSFFVIKMNLSAGFDYYGLAQNRNNSANSYIQMFASATQAFTYLYGANVSGSRTGAMSADPASLPTNDTYYVHVVRKDAASGANVRFQKDELTMVDTPFFSSSQTVTLNTLGYGSVGDRGLNGSVREFALYNTALTDEEVQSVIDDMQSRNGIS